MPFEVASRDGVLTLTLDTPGSPINIFNHATARQLIEILSDVSPATTRALVFATAKTNSFINGVGLLLAQAARNVEDVRRASAPPWTAYRMVRDAPVPTIAVVEGNCFGCGVEFVLGCDFRIAADSWETQFYMTELNDYLFLPLFGSTWNLPETVGLSDAIDLLLWGDRWDGAKAFARGLADELAPHEHLAEHRRDFVERVLHGRQRSRRRGRIAWDAHEEQVLERARQRIASLPPRYHQLYGEALALLETGARQTRSYVEHQKREELHSAASALSEMGKSAYGFFYLRQMAGERATGRLRGTEPAVRIAVDVPAADPERPFADDLRSRRLRGVTFGTEGDADFTLIAATVAPPSRQGVALRTRLAPGPTAGVELYAPAYAGGGRLVELATRERDGVRHDERSMQALARVLRRLGFEVARTMPRAEFVSSRLLAAFLAPLARFLEEGGDVPTVNATLREEGYMRPPADLLASLDPSRAAVLVGDAVARPPAEIGRHIAALATRRDRGAAPDETLVDALALSLLHPVLASRDGGEIRDTSITDLIARELLEFPRHLCSLATWLRRARVAAALANTHARRLVAVEAIRAAEGFVADGREFHR